MMSENRKQERILIVTDAWFPQKNGVVTAFRKILELSEERGYSVSIIHPTLFRRSWPIPFYREIELVLFPGTRLRELIRTSDADYIHIATEGTLGLSARRYCVRNNIPFTTSYHTHYPDYMKLRMGTIFGIVVSYLRWFHSRSSHVMVASESLSHQLKEWGFKNLSLWPLGVDSEKFYRVLSPVVPEYLQKFPRPYYLYFGRVAIEKNVDAFLSCELKGTKIVAGGGPELEALKRRYSGRAVFVYENGYSVDDEFLNLVSCADVCVMPSKTETFGLVVLEALSCSLPVAAYDVMGPKDIIVNGVHGFLGEDISQCAQKCLTLDRIALRSRALEFSWERSCEMFLRALVTTHPSR